MSISCRVRRTSDNVIVLGPVDITSLSYYADMVLDVPTTTGSGVTNCYALEVYITAGETVTGTSILAMSVKS
jgi:hypothetical protein